jgi:hypothetical protein
LNFKFICLLILITGCGVKGDPVAPRTPVTPSLLQNYPDIETDKPIDDVKKGIKSSSRR